MSRCAPESETNEDSVFLDPTAGLFVLADGIGGRSGGEIASRMTVDLLREGAKDWEAGIPSDSSLELLVRDVNSKVRERAAVDPTLSGMGSTVSALVIRGEDGKMVHLGDSKVFLLRDGFLRQLSMDHTAEGEFRRCDPGSSVVLHPRFRNMLTRAIGIEEDVEPQIESFRVQASDRFVLASDGLTKVMEPEEIRTAGELARNQGASALCESLMGIAEARHPLDDFTVGVIAVQGGDPLKGKVS